MIFPIHEKGAAVTLDHNQSRSNESGKRDTITRTSFLHRLLTQRARAFKRNLTFSVMVVRRNKSVVASFNNHPECHLAKP